MNVTANIKVDKAGFFRFIATQAEGRFEYERGRIVEQMTGGTLAHSLISQRFISVFERRLDADAWAVTGHSRGVETPATVRYPDVVVEPMSDALQQLSTEVPAIIVEVLSPATEALDLGPKASEYREVVSLHAYIVAQQDQAKCWLWLRSAAGVMPETPAEIAGQDSIVVPGLALSVPLSEIYRGIVRGP